MGRMCAYPGCDNNMSTWTKYSFHRLPLCNRDVLKLWLVVLKMDPKITIPRLRRLDYRVCSAHFSPEDFFPLREMKEGQRFQHQHIRKNVVPLAAEEHTQKAGTRDVACQYSPTQRDVFIQTSKSSIPTKSSTHSKASHSVAVGCSIAEFTELGLTSRPIRSKRKRVQLEELSTESNNARYERRYQVCSAPCKDTVQPLRPQVSNVKDSPDRDRENTDDAFKSRRCSVVRCDSWRRGVQCFSLPADSDKRLEWVQFLFLVNGQRIKESSWVDIRVCAEHFTPSCFLQVNPAASIALLNTDAVPSVYKETTEPIDPAFKPDQIKTSAGPTPGSSALDKEEISALSAPGSPALSTVSESSESSYCRMLQKIENLDIIREKINLLQRMKMYVVNEKQLLQLFSAKCPLCQSKVKMEKSFHGVLLVMNQHCLQCSYSRQWKNLSEKSISALLDDHQAECLEISVEISADEMSSEKDQIAEEEGDHREERDEPSKTDKVENSDDNWEPEHESLILDSDEDEDEDEDYNPSDEDTEESAPKQRELCTECGKLFKTRRPHICEYKIKPFSCNICGKRCVSEQSLAIHSKIHNTNHQFLCKFCLAGFKTKTDKNNHEQIHSGEERPYKCPHCSEMFDTFKNRQVHMKDHPKQGLLKCHICGMEFLYFKVFQRHLLVHTGEKPFKCSVCERGFNQSGHLKSHMRMHTGERPYKCQHCNRGFNHNVSLKSHLKRFHTESENQKKTANLGGSVGGDPEGERGTDSLNDIVEEDHAVKDVWTGGGGFKKRTTGRPIGRPKKKIKDTTVEEEKQQRQDKNTDTAKRRNRKPRKRQYSSEDDEEELCEIE